MPYVLGDVRKLILLLLGVETIQPDTLTSHYSAQQTERYQRKASLRISESEIMTNV